MKKKLEKELRLPDKPTDKQILSWLKTHELPMDCLEAVRTWVDACENDGVRFGPGFSINIASIAIAGGVDYYDAMALEEKVEAYSKYSGG
jgi:hypothetical protein